MELISISFYHIFIFICIFLKSIERNKTDMYLNNIIILNGYQLRYVNFANNSNGDMIFYSTACPNTTQRAFYGFKKNGRPLFQNESNYNNSINATIRNQRKYESKTIFIKPYFNCPKEYLMSVGKENSSVEIYDIDNRKIYEKSINSFSNLEVQSFRNEAIFLQSNNTGNYYLFGFAFNQPTGNNIIYKNFSIQIHKFNFSLKNFKNENTLIINHNIEKAFSDSIGISCFKTDNSNIFCFYLNDDRNYNIVAYDFTLKEKKSITLDEKCNISEDNKPFYKCIHLKKK